ncbi:hypothetical protein L6270_05135 [Candidatus Parcubacteria bacterium]|nr:hypothetical protein [Patescibacteria group bacterium]MBU4309344.1 hypothetical protein [Patescibacteria group bacterium]MBU4431840.1 hypothetical protein [Patescibacteria group bacterium]MBU4577705.1 hypothetical protein [Patescibacteria group bacterium]MCG2697391.1 hypothetical protein [Candidatus Parcubacteria bacterium]
MATKKTKVNNKKVAAKKGTVIKDLAPGELQKLANAGTKEAIAKIEQYLKIEQDEEKRAYAEMALEECEFIYYQPNSEKEDQEFMLCELIRRRKIDLEDLMMEAGAVQMKLDKLMLEKKVHDKIIAKHKDKKEVWQYNYIPDFLLTEKDALQQLEDMIGYEEEWIAEAKKMITAPRYKNIPDHHLAHFAFEFDEALDEGEDDEADYDDADYDMATEVDEDGYDYEDDDCCSDGSCSCGN